MSLEGVETLVRLEREKAALQTRIDTLCKSLEASGENITLIRQRVIKRVGKC